MAAALPTTVGAQRDPDSIKLFVGQIPRTFTEQNLRELFSPLGEIFDVTIVRDHTSNISKGCGFVTYLTRASAVEAMGRFHDKITLPGMTKTLQVKPADSESRPPAWGADASTGEKKVFFGMLSKTYSEDDLSKLCAQYCAPSDVTILRNPDGSSKGCAFVHFHTHEDAQRIIATLNNSFTMEGCRAPLVVKYAESEKEKAMKRIQQQTSYMMGSMMGGYMGYGMPGQQQYGYRGQMPVSFQDPSVAYPYIQDYQNRYQADASAESGAYGMGQMAGGAGMGQMAGGMGQMAGGAGMAAQMGGGMGGGITAALAAAGQKEGPPNCNLFIYHIPSHYNDVLLANEFSPFGNVISAKVFVDKSTGQSKGFGFVSFDNPSSSQAAITSMNGRQVGSKRLKVELKRPKASPY